MSLCRPQRQRRSFKRKKTVHHTKCQAPRDTREGDTVTWIWDQNVVNIGLCSGATSSIFWVCNFNTSETLVTIRAAMDARFANAVDVVGILKNDKM